jgi:beta-barrel assembly-enhancing protease
VVNAFTLPGGSQYINRGLLLQLDGEGELASLLARGIAHNALRTASREATKAELTQLANVPLALSGPGALTPVGWSTAIPLAQLKMRRQDEFDADYFAVQYVYKAGYDPKCFIDFVQKVWGASLGTGKNIPKVFDTFPPLDERLAALRTEISAILPQRDGAIVNTAEFDTFKQRLPAQKSSPELKRPTDKMAAQPKP